MNPPYMPDGEMVAEAYINSLGQNFGCSTVLPFDTSEWEEHGYIRIAGVIAEPINIYTGVRSSVVQIESYAYDSNGAFPPRWLASHNLQYIIQTCSVGQQMGFAGVYMPDDYYGVALMDCYSLNGARIKPGDQGGYACYMAELTFSWYPLNITVPSPDPSPDPTPDPSGDLPNLVFDFSNSMVWSANHNLGYLPVLQVFDLDNNEIEAEVHVTTTSFSITFSQPSSGKVVVSR